MIISYNFSQMDDILLVILAKNKGLQQSIKLQDSILEIKDKKSGEIVGYNFLHASKLLPKLKDNKYKGEVNLNEKELGMLNDNLKKAGFKALLKLNQLPKYLVGHVKSVKDHPKSNHLKITETEIGNGRKLQIISSSPNMQKDIKVVVALPGSMMPNGMIIWPNKLKGIESEGMIASARELKIKNAPNKPGALILPDHYTVGDSFNPKKANHLFDK